MRQDKNKTFITDFYSDKHSELQILAEISRVLNESNNTNSVFSKLLEICHEQLNLIRSYLVSFNQTNGNLNLEAAKGVTAAEFRRMENLLRKSFVGEVVRENKIVVLRDIAKESTFLSVNDVTNDEKSPRSCVCVPIVSGRNSLGAFGIEFLPESNHDYEKTAEFLSVVAGMIAQTIKMNRLVEREKEQRLQEDPTLRQE